MLALQLRVKMVKTVVAMVAVREMTVIQIYSSPPPTIYT